MVQKEYTGSVYIAVVGTDIEYAECRDSIDAIIKRHGDSRWHRTRATKGYEARQLHINNFIKSHHDFIFLMDGDMTFPNDALERLRSHKMPYVSGFYMRRSFKNMGPIWFHPFEKFPMLPWLEPIPEDGLVEIGASGWGCILIHRDVIMAVRSLLKGEHEVLEDDLDVWPYDLKRIMGAINGLQELIDTGVSRKAARQAYVDILKEEIRPLRCDRAQVGSDIRFPFYALQAGYQLYGDPAVQCGHMSNYPISQVDYNAFSEDELRTAEAQMRESNSKARNEAEKEYKVVMNA